jgi:glycogen debranching enzyme
LERNGRCQACPISSPSFDEFKYWQGPTWININWLVIDGLKRHGYFKEALALKKRTLELVKKSGCYEYFSPKDGSPAGAERILAGPPPWQLI